MAAESTTVKQKVSAPAVRLVGTEGACNACKKAGIATECAYGTGMDRESPLKQRGAQRRQRSSSRQ